MVHVLFQTHTYAFNKKKTFIHIQIFEESK